MPQSYEIRIGTKNLLDVCDDGELAVSRSHTHHGEQWLEFREDFSIDLMTTIRRCGIDPVDIFAAGLAIAFEGEPDSTSSLSPERARALWAFLRAACDYAEAIGVEP